MGSKGTVPRLLRFLDEGKLRAIIGETLPLAQVAEGHRRLEERGVFGKVVLVPDKKTEASHGG